VTLHKDLLHPHTHVPEPTELHPPLTTGKFVRILQEPVFPAQEPTPRPPPAQMEAATMVPGTVMGTQGHAMEPVRMASAILGQQPVIYNRVRTLRHRTATATHAIHGVHGLAWVMTDTGQGPAQKDSVIPTPMIAVPAQLLKKRQYLATGRATVTIPVRTGTALQRR
jgi:hypothetical protein